MEIMSQKRYQEYRKQLKEQRYSHIETHVNIPNKQTLEILEKRLGCMPWDLLKFPVNM